MDHTRVWGRDGELLEEDDLDQELLEDDLEDDERFEEELEEPAVAIARVIERMDREISRMRKLQREL